MGKPVKFEVESSPDYHCVKEVGFGTIGSWRSKAPAAAIAAYMNEEHKHGRVAQGHCSKGEACDRERIHDVRAFLTYGRGRQVVLCGDHRVEIDGVAATMGRA